MGSLSQRDLLFLVWNAGVGLVVGALIARRPELRAGAIPPFLWLVLGMAVFEIANSFSFRSGPPLTNLIRMAGLTIAFGAYLGAAALLSRPDIGPDGASMLFRGAI